MKTSFVRPAEWRLISNTGSAPSGLYSNGQGCTVWSGNEVYMWSGWDTTNTRVRVGYRYNPVTDTWAALPTVAGLGPRSVHHCEWVGGKFLVWGGFDTELNAWSSTGYLYSPSENSWTAMSTTGAPSGRGLGASASTGTKFIVWGGGINNTTTYANGAVYDVETNTWTAMATTGAPSQRSYTRGVWAGSKFILWGGAPTSTGELNTGGVYNLSTDSWTSMTTTGAPSPRRWASNVWTGTEYLVWSGHGTAGNSLDDGGLYNPATDTWRPINTANAPQGRLWGSTVWTGTHFLVWGGVRWVASAGTIRYNTGAMYDPNTGIWAETLRTSDLSPRDSTFATWMGDALFIFGGADTTSNIFSNGAILIP